MRIMSFVKGICMSVFFFTTLAGNSLVVYIGKKHWSHTSHHITHFLVFNLAIADLVVTLLAVPFEAVEEFLENWVFGKAWCKVVEYIQGVSLSASVFIITFIAIDRYLCIVRPLTTRFKSRHGKYIVTFCWVFPFLLCIPYLFMYFVEEQPLDPGGNVTTLICESHGLPIEWLSKVYWFAEMYFTIFLPLVIMIFCYSRLIKKVLSMKKVGEPSRDLSRLQEHHPNAVPVSQSNNLRRIKHKSIGLTLAFLTVFLVCWTPKFVLECMRLAYGARHVNRRSTVYEVALFMSYVNETLNPIIYAMFDPFFRDKVARFFGKKDSLSGFGTTDTASLNN